MIYEIVKSNFNPELIIFRDIDSSFDRCAWAMYEMLQDAGLHRNVRVGCFDGYENCIVFEEKNFRD